MFFRRKKEEKTVKKWDIILICAVLAAALAVKAYVAYWPKAIIDINGNELKVLVANTSRHLYKGWSGKAGMGKYQGMLFIFVEKGQHVMVMRDMKFAIDIVWLDGSMIVDIAPNVKPEEPIANSQLTPYFARLPSTMVLELPAGFTQKNKVKIGDRIKIAK